MQTAALRLGFLAAVAATPLAAWAEYSVDWRAGRLSVTAKDAPRADLLREVAKRTGTRVTGLEFLQDKVSLTLSSVDLASGLRVLAGDSSYALVEMPGRGAHDPKRYQLLVVATAKDRTAPAPIIGAHGGRVMPPMNAPGQMQAQPPAIHQQDVLRNAPPSTTVEDPETGHRVKPPDDQ